jgi:hypothetical protein
VSNFQKFFYSKPAWPNEQTLGGSIYGRSVMKISLFVSIKWINKHDRHHQFCFWLVNFQNFGKCQFWSFSLPEKKMAGTLYKGLPIDAPTKFRFIWPSGFRGEEFFKNQPLRNKSRLWRPCLLMDRDEMSNLYRGPSIHAFYQISVQNFEHIDCDIWFIELVGLAKHHHFNAHIWKSPLPITLLIDKCELEESTWRIKIRSLSLE